MLTRQEVWTSVPGYEATYEISDHGRVRSLPRPRTPGGIRKIRFDRHGYPFVDLYQDGKGCRRRTHILVALAFIGPRPVGSQVRHLDGDSSNPHVSNLAYGTPRENGLDSVAHGTNFSIKKTECPQGHPYDETNTYRWRGRRWCKACRLARARRRAARNA